MINKFTYKLIYRPLSMTNSEHKRESVEKIHLQA